MSDRNEKLTRIRNYLKKKKLEAMVLTTRANFAWVTGGGDNHVVSQAEDGVAAVLVTPRKVQVLANAIEMNRIVGEEPINGWDQKVYPWVQPLAEVVAKVLGPRAGKSVGDSAATGLKPLASDFIDECRASLTKESIRQYKSLGRDCALCIETVARALSPGDSGFQVEADLARHLLARGIQPHVLLVAFDDRLKAHRHPTPTANHLRHHAMLVVCGQRNGLIASLTRFVHFGRLPEDLRARHESSCRVEAALWQATKVGEKWGEVLKQGIAQYKKEGFAKEWELHHQGGPTGYAGRDILVTPSEARKVVADQAVAWNPSITGTKTEDTFIVGADNERLVVTEASSAWPTVTVTHNGERFQRPDILVR